MHPRVLREQAEKAQLLSITFEKLWHFNIEGGRLRKMERNFLPRSVVTGQGATVLS